MEKAYEVIPDSERLDIGTNHPVAIFKYKHHAVEWAESMWYGFVIIREIESNYFQKGNNSRLEPERPPDPEKDNPDND